MVHPREMPRCLLCLTVALAPAVAVAQDADPMQSVACQIAMRAVGNQEAKVAAAEQLDPLAGLPQNQAALAQLEASRQHAAQTCLGSRQRPASRPDRLSPRGRLMQPPITPPSSRPNSRTP